MLVDTASYAAAMVGAHPDLMSIEPGSAHIVHSNYIDTDINTACSRISCRTRLTVRRCRRSRPARRTRPAGARSPSSRMTTGAPMKNTLGQQQGPASSTSRLSPRRRRLGRRRFGGHRVGDEERRRARPRRHRPQAADRPQRRPRSDVAGALWFRHDGIANLTGRAGAGRAAPPVSMALKNGTPGAWLWPSATSSVNGDRQRADGARSGSTGACASSASTCSS